jgi:uncharacterized protein
MGSASCPLNCRSRWSKRSPQSWGWPFRPSWSLRPRVARKACEICWSACCGGGSDSHWYLFVLFGLPMGVLLSAIVLHGAAPLGALARNWALLFTAFLPGVIVPFLHTNLWEELGWTGFLQSTLQDRRGPLLASLIVVPFFALFHLPARFVAGWIVDDHTPLAQVPTVALGYFLSAAVVAVFLRVLIMWIYNGSGRSLIVVGLFHSAFNITIGNEVMPELLNLPASETSLMCLGVLVVLAVVVVVFTRGRLAYEGRPAGAVGVAAQPKMR